MLEKGSCGRHITESSFLAFRHSPSPAPYLGPLAASAASCKIARREPTQWQHSHPHSDSHQQIVFKGKLQPVGGGDAQVTETQR